MSEIKYMNNERVEELIAEVKRRLGLKQDVMQYLVAPTLTSGLVGSVFQYIGDDTVSYKNGAFYRVIVDPEDSIIKTVQVAYNKAQLDEIIESLGQFALVKTLPTTDIKQNTIYLVPKKESKEGYEDATANVFYVDNGDGTYDEYDEDGAFVETVTDDDATAVATAIADETYAATTKSVDQKDGDNIKDEWINVDGTATGWEKVGDTGLSLIGYVREEDLVPITTEELADMWRSVGVLTLSANSVSVAEGDSDTVTCTATGTITVESGDTDIATVSYADGVITITGVATGDTEITVKSGVTSDHKEVVKTITVTVTA